LSLRVAGALMGKKESEIAMPATGLLHFVAPSRLPGTITYEELRSDPGVAGFLRDQCVLAGENSDSDSFETPFGKVAGVNIHAFAAESLVHGRFITHIPFWQNFLLIFAVCYIVAALVAQGVSVPKLLMFVSAASLAMLLFAGLTIRLWRVWIDVVYFIAAVWLLVPLLVAWRHLEGRNTRSTNGTN
jgi:CHASE2 domain-containing sensor protein